MNYLDENGLKRVLTKIKKLFEKTDNSVDEKLLNKEDKRKYIYVNQLHSEALSEITEDCIIVITTIPDSALNLGDFHEYASLSRFKHVTIYFQTGITSVTLPNKYKFHYSNDSALKLMSGVQYELDIRYSPLGSQYNIELKEYIKRYYESTAVFSFPEYGLYTIGRPYEEIEIDGRVIKLPYSGSYNFTPGEYTIKYITSNNSYNSKFLDNKYIKEFIIDLDSDASPVDLTSALENSSVEYAKINLSCISKRVFNLFKNCSNLTHIELTGTPTSSELDASCFEGLPDTGICKCESSAVAYVVKHYLPTGWTVE